MPEPILIAIAAAVAGKAAGSLYDMVKRKFAGRKEALAALEAAEGTSADSPEVGALAQELAMAEAYDPRFSERLRAEWTTVQAQAGGVANNVSGSVTGNVVQARDIHGDITFGA